jgi:DNA-binding winged helix-turn-helix (wHTH) protein
MGVPTVFMVGTDRLALIPEYLNLGSVVVIAPDQPTLKIWQGETDPQAARSTSEGERSVVVDMSGRRIIHEGASLPLSELEFKVLGALLSEVGRAWSFRELRRAGWGDGPDLPVDPYTVKALIQRLRAKLEVARAPIVLEAVRGYGFRVRQPTPVNAWRRRDAASARPLDRS